MKKTILGALALCMVLGMTGCTAGAPAPSAQPTSAAPTASPKPTPTRAPSATPAKNPTPAPEMTVTTPGTAQVGDGTYRAEMSEAAAQQDGGWKGYLELTVAQGAVEAAEFDYVKDGAKKSEATQEEYPMNPPPSQWIPAYRKAVEAAGLSGDVIDTVTGATSSGKDVNALYQAVLEAAREGNAKTVTVEKPAQ